LIKKIILLGLVLLNSVQALPTQAEPFPSITVIDSGINTSLFKDNIVYEVCIVSEFTCPNGKKFMEGEGAANIPVSNSKILNHGTRMLSVITQVNPKAKVILIRIVGIDPKGKPADYYTEDIDNALVWITKNQKKYNISVVSLSQGNTFKTCDVSTVFKKQVNLLKKVNVPVIAAAGNDGNKKPVFTPACWKEVISVGAVTSGGVIQTYSNAKGKVDIYIPDNYTSRMLDNSTKTTIGTSNSTAALSAWWLLNKRDSFKETYDYLLSLTKPASNYLIKGAYFELE
jgi:hypothetical protein